MERRRFSIWLWNGCFYGGNKTNLNVFANMTGLLLDLNISFEIDHSGGSAELHIRTGSDEVNINKYLYGRFLIWQNSYRLKM